MKGTPTVSVLLPAWNCAGTLTFALQSMRTQSLRALEVIVVDDGSTDSTAAVAERAAAEDPRVTVVRQPHQGLVAALNHGLRHCRAPYIARMDGDDISLPARLERSVAALERDATLAGVGTQVRVIGTAAPASPNLEAYAAWLNAQTDPHTLFLNRLVESPLCHPSVTLRAEALRGVAGYREGDVPEDWDLWLRLLRAGHRLQCIAPVLHEWRDHDHRLTRRDPRYGFDRHHALKADELARAVGPGREVVMVGATEIGKQVSGLLAARGVRTRHFVDVNPRKVGQHIAGAPVVSPEALVKTDAFAVGAVGAKGAREEIRALLRSKGFIEGDEFLCIA